MIIRRFWRIGSALFTIIFVLILAVSEVQAQVWTASITAKSFDPRLPTPISVEFGINPDSTNGFDPDLDVLTDWQPLPVDPDLPYLNIAFVGPGLSYFSTDIRPAGPWKCIVISRDAFTLSWDISSVPSDVYLVMDPGGDIPIINMRAITSETFPAGSYSMIIKEGKYGDLSGNRKITPFDASLVLQYIVGLINLSPEQQIAADVTGDKKVSAFDAAIILKYTVGLITQLPVK